MISCAIFSHPSAVPVGREGGQRHGTLVIDCYIHRDNQSGTSFRVQRWY
jgi:hypothetical protein